MLNPCEESRVVTNTHFIDAKLGGTFLSVGKEGNIIDGSKAVRTKTSYHAAEHGLLNCLYLDYWVLHKPVTLYYHINARVKEDFFPLLLEDDDYQVSEVLIDGKPLEKVDHTKGSITLPDKAGYNMTVRVQKK